MKSIAFTGMFVSLVLSTSASAECISCQIHKQGGAYLGSYQAPLYPATPYYGRRNYRNYGYGGYPGGGQGSLRHSCGPDGRCVTSYRGNASDIQHLPQINRQIQQTRPSRMHINPQPRPVPLPSTR
jgi:hypothetical protein